MVIPPAVLDLNHDEHEHHQKGTSTATREQYSREDAGMPKGVSSACLFGIPAVFRGNAVSRVAVLVAFLAAVVFMFVMV